jgi:putative ABC transport system substrate-binding protein
MRRIGFLGAATPAVASQWVAAFVQRLRELGWIENRNIEIEYRWAECRSERFAEIAREFVRLKVDVIMTWSGGPVIAAKQATTVIPIVFAGQTDPVGIGRTRPSVTVCSATGLSMQQTDTVGKGSGVARVYFAPRPTSDRRPMPTVRALCSRWPRWWRPRENSALRS